MSKRTILRTAIAGTAALATVVGVSAFGISAANADPSGSVTYSAAGSDTIQDLYNGFQGLGTTGIGSWYATGGGTIVPTSALNPSNTNSIPRPNGSGDGRKALSGAWSSTHSKTIAGTATTVPNYSISIGRSSGKPGSSVTANTNNDKETFVPLARDAVGVATFGSDLTGVSFNTAQLEAIYGAADDAGNAPHASEGVYLQGGGYDSDPAGHDYLFDGGLQVGDIVRDTTDPAADPELVTDVDGSGSINTAVPLNVLLPQSASGTRQFFETALGNASTAAAASWVNDSHEENTASEVIGGGDGTIIPFSAAQYINQYNNAAAGTGVKTTDFNYNDINTVNPVVISGTASPNSAFFGATNAQPTAGIGHFNRDVYSVIPTQVWRVASSGLSLADGFDDASVPFYTQTAGGFDNNAADQSYADNLVTLVTTTLPQSSLITAFGFEQLDTTTSSSDYFPTSAHEQAWPHSNWE